MARHHDIARGDTLVKIARRYYDDAGLCDELARYNGILEPDRILIGQRVEIPSRRELTKPLAEPDADSGRPATPHGLAGLLETFGNIYEHLREDGTLDGGFERKHMERVDLPLALALSWDYSRRITQLYCHKLLAPVFLDVFDAIRRENLRGEIRTFGGCFSYRPKRAGSKLSTHSWAIAIDINPETNAMGTKGNMHPGIVEIFEEHGFKWGGDWPARSKDPMHFQYCTGY